MKNNNWTHWEYLRHYNIQDTRIMVPALKFLINDNIKFGIDMQNFLSLSSYASAIKFIMCYDTFDINENYDLPFVINPYTMTAQMWKNKIKNYNNLAVKYVEEPIKPKAFVGSEC